MEINLTEVLREGVQAHERGDLEAARTAYQRILSVAPEHADAMHLLGVIAFQVGALTEARERIERAIGVDPKIPMYHANLGRVLRASRNDDGAVDAFKDAVRLEPNNAVLHADLASALIGAGDVDAARSRCHLALELDPSLAAAHLNLGLALQELKSPGDPEAVASIERAIVFDPNLAGAYLALGVAAHETGDTVNAEEAYGRALQLDPGFIEAHCNLGNIRRDMFDFDTAMRHYKNALAIDDSIAEVWGNLGVTLQEMGALGPALEAYDRAVERDVENPEFRRNRGMARLAAGDFSGGWEDYEYRWQTQRFRSMVRNFGVPRWNGADPKGMRILVHAEQGLGDTIQFSRYVPLLVNLGAAVTFECPDALHPVLRGVKGARDVISPGAPLPKIDAHIPLLSLPGLLGTTVATIPGPEKHRAPADRAEIWKARVSGWPQGVRIGIAWRGRPDHVRDALRSPGLKPFLGLQEIDGIVLVSLQKENAADEMAALPGAERIVDPTEDLTDFGETAALMEQLDLVISCDSAPLHLAGTLGIDAIAVLPQVPEWRWMIKEDQTPWYPNARLIRQPAFGDWESVFSRIADDLHDFVAKASKTS